MLLGSSDGWGHIPLLAGPPTSQAPRCPGPGQRPSYLGCVFLEHLPQATVGPPLLGVLWDQTRSARHKATEESAQPARWDRGAQRCRTLPGGEGPQGKPRATPVLPWHAPKPTPTAGSLTAVHTPVSAGGGDQLQTPILSGAPSAVLVTQSQGRALWRDRPRAVRTARQGWEPPSHHVSAQLPPHCPWSPTLAFLGLVRP